MSPSARPDEAENAVRSFGRRHSWWRFAAPAVLVLLEEEPTHGYALLDRLPGLVPRSVRRADAGTLYRFLHTLEAEGFVRSTWSLPRSGPPRRVYSVTDAGRRELARWRGEIEREIAALQGLLARSSPAPPAPPAG